MSELDVESRAAETDPSIEYDADGETYTIRRFRPGDRAGFLDLFEGIESLSLGGGSDWFTWKYEAVPYLVHVPIFLAEHDGEVVGARPFLPFRLRVGPRTLLGLQTTDTIVHPDHRGRGVFSRMNDLAFAYYRKREPAVLFSIPNRRSRPGYLDMGARVVGPITTSMRIERPSTFVGEKLGEWAPERTGSVLDGLAGGYLRVRDRRRNGFVPNDVTVERRATVPADTLASLAETAVPDPIHVHRDQQFYEWRFENPHWQYDAYLASRDGDHIAALLTASRTFDGRRVTHLSDVVPLAGEQRVPGLAAILDRLLRVEADTDLFSFAGSAMPDGLLSRFGFRPDDELPLSPFANPTILITMPLTPDGPDGDGWTIEGRDLTDLGSWLLPYCERNTG